MKRTISHLSFIITPGRGFMHNFEEAMKQAREKLTSYARLNKRELLVTIEVAETEKKEYAETD